MHTCITKYTGSIKVPVLVILPKSDTQIFCGGKLLLIHVTNKGLITCVTDTRDGVCMAATFINDVRVAGKSYHVNMRPGTRRNMLVAML